MINVIITIKSIQTTIYTYQYVAIYLAPNGCLSYLVAIFGFSFSNPQFSSGLKVNAYNEMYHLVVYK